MWVLDRLFGTQSTPVGYLVPYRVLQQLVPEYRVDKIMFDVFRNRGVENTRIVWVFIFNLLYGFLIRIRTT